MQLLSLHNVHYLIHLLRGLRESVINGTTLEYAKDFFDNYYSGEAETEKGIPNWVRSAMKEAGIDLS
jgi:queuine tRNA-ribosyltransferase catalytic subunit